MHSTEPINLHLAPLLSHWTDSHHDTWANRGSSTGSERIWL